MGILDEAIREHLELKRQHGAGDSELQQLEDEAFGPPDRPGGEVAIDNPFAEAPTEFMATPDEEGTPSPEPIDRLPDAEGETGARRESPGIADLQEPPPHNSPSEEDEMAGDPSEEGQLPADDDDEAGPGTGSPTTDERRAIAEQPTELFDVEAEIDATQSSAPSDEELAEEEVAEPRLAPIDPFAGLGEPDVEPERVIGTEEDEEEEDYFDEQRLSDELDQALEAPVESGEAPAEPEDDAGEEAEVEAGEPDKEAAPDPETDGEDDDRDREDDVLEDTPDFLENSDDDELWFEQKPPKDFDFDD